MRDWGRVKSPWQAVLCFDGEISSASFALPACIVRIEHYRFLGGRGVHVHIIIIIVGHLENVEY